MGSTNRCIRREDGAAEGFVEHQSGLGQQLCTDALSLGHQGVLAGERRTAGTQHTVFVAAGPWTTFHFSRWYLAEVRWQMVS